MNGRDTGNDLPSTYWRSWTRRTSRRASGVSAQSPDRRATTAVRVEEAAAAIAFTFPLLPEQFAQPQARGGPGGDGVVGGVGMGDTGGGGGRSHRSGRRQAESPRMDPRPGAGGALGGPAGFDDLWAEMLAMDDAVMAAANAIPGGAADTGQPAPVQVLHFGVDGRGGWGGMAVPGFATMHSGAAAGAVPGTVATGGAGGVEDSHRPRRQSRRRPRHIAGEDRG